MWKESQTMIGERKHIMNHRSGFGIYKGLCHKNIILRSFSKQKATSGSLIHFGLIQYLILLYPDVIKSPKQKNKVRPFLNAELNVTNFKTFCIQM